MAIRAARRQVNHQRTLAPRMAVEVFRDTPCLERPLRSIRGRSAARWNRPWGASSDPGAP
jgi:hypothetical protein